MTSVDGLDQDSLSRAGKQEDPSDMEYNHQRLELLFSFLRPFLKFLFEWHINDQLMEAHLKRLDSALQNVIWDFKPPASDSQSNPADALGAGSEDWEHSSPTMEQLVVSKLSFLKDLKDEINEVVFLHNCRCVSSDLVTWEKAECLVIFISSLLQNSQDIVLISVKNEVGLEQLEERIKFLINFLWLTANPIFEFGKKKAVLNSAQELAVEILLQLYFCLAYGDDDDELVGDHMRKDILPDLLRKINTLLLDVIRVYNGYDSIRLPDGNHVMNDHVLGFVDFLIQKLNKLRSKLNSESSFTIAVKVQIEILVHELSFLRCSLMDLLLQPVPDVEMTISTLALIVKTGIFVYLSLDEQEGGELMAKHLSFGLPVLLEAVGALGQQASDLCSYYYFPPLQTKSPCTNELEFVNILEKELEGLISSNEASITALELQIEMIKEEIISLRKCFNEISELGKSQIEFLLTRFRDAAFLAKYVIDSFMAGEDSLWFQKLGLYVVTKDIRIMQKEIKSLVELTCHANVLNVATASSPASSQADNPPKTNAAVGSKDEIQIKVDEPNNKLVGLKGATMEIMEQLMGGPRQLKILSIVGMPGLGKTTLANSVYNHPSVGINFHVRAWCCLSHVYDKEAVLFSILGQIVQEINQNHEISAEDIIQKLYQNLKGRRYLIVLDDIWNIEAWNGLKEIFPDDENGSRILFTTRMHAVALEVDSLVYTHCLLTNKESYDLLSLRLFDGETCPKELSVVLERIACSCKGLPLAGVLIAGTLKGIERKGDSWERIAKVLIRSQQIWEILEVSYKHLPDHLKACFCYFGTFPQGTTISVSKMIQLWISEGYVQQPNLGHKSLKQVAQSYLNDLIGRNLVMIARRSSQGGVKACIVHDVLREFCSAKLEKKQSVIQENMSGGIAVLYGGFKQHKLNRLPFSSPSKVPHMHSLVYYNKSDTDMNSGERENTSELHEFCGTDSSVYYNKSNRDMNSGERKKTIELDEFWDFDSGKREKTIEVFEPSHSNSGETGETIDLDETSNSDFGEETTEPVEYWASGSRNYLSELLFRDLQSIGRYNHISEPTVFRNRFVMLGTRTSQHRRLDYGSIPNYNYLRVLDLGNVRVQSSANTSDLVKIAKLVHLKYLAVRIHTIEIPSEIGNLQNLETFILSGAIGEVILPEAIWKLVSLRHVIMNHCFFSFQHYSQEFFETSSPLNNLESISTLFICDGNVEKFLRRLPNIKKLGCRFPNSWYDYYEACNLYRILKFLGEIQSLKMSFHAKAPYPFKFSFPSNLKKLTMSNSSLPWDGLSVIGQLPNLEVLKLLNKAFVGHQLDMREGEFQKLKFLKLDSLDIVLWNASSEHLPCIEQLVVVSCQQLEEIPSCFGEIPTLQLIEMKWCSSSATDSVKQILQDQHDLSNDQLKVILAGAQQHLA